MRAVFKRQGLRPFNVVETQWPIEMREQRPPAGGLPPQVGIQGIGIERQQEQPVLLRKMLGCCFGGLRGGRKMHVAIRYVDRRPRGFPLLAQLGPFIGPENLVDQHPDVVPAAATTVKARPTVTGPLSGRRAGRRTSALTPSGGRATMR